MARGKIKHPKKFTVGRPTKLTPKITEAILTFIRFGCWPEVAAEANGVAANTLALWLRRGCQYLDATERGEPYLEVAPLAKYGQFALDMRQAVAQAEINDLKRLDQFADALSPMWRAAAWKLERRSQKREETSWALQQRIKAETTILPPPQQRPGEVLDQLNLSLEVRVEILAALKRRREEAEKAARPALPPPALPQGEVIEADVIVHVQPPNGSVDGSASRS